MKRTLLSFSGVLVVCALLLVFCVPTFAQNTAQSTFLYVNDDPFASNTVEGFSVNAIGQLTALAGSPFSTGGTGGGGGYFVSAKTTMQSAGNFFYATNGGSNDISLFDLNPSTGILTLVGSPTATGGSGFSPIYGQVGIGTAMTHDGKFLFTINGGSNNISAFSIGTGGALSAVKGSPFSTVDSPDSGLVTRDNKFLIVTEPNTLQIEVFSIQSDGSLKSVAGSPFAAAGSAAGLDTDCAGAHIFVGDASFTETIEVYTISSTGALTAISGSPFGSSLGFNSNGVLLSKDDTILYVTNQSSSSITSYSVAADGSLSALVLSRDGSSLGDAPSGLSIDSTGKHIFTGNFNLNTFIGSVASLGVPSTTKAPLGTVHLAKGSPTLTAAGSVPLSVEAFPTKTCAVK